ncbi:MAG: phosphomannomutase, partial [Candidatus Kariarchaeaceae archaeon]
MGSRNMDNLAIFRAYDVRGIFGQDLSVEVMLNIGRAFGTYLIRKNLVQVTVGGDIRASTPILQQALISGICSTGISCDVVSKSPLGITLFHSFSNKYAASAFITASHLPPEWNGVKFYWGPGIGFSPEENMEIQSIFESKDFESKDAFNVGQVLSVDPYHPFLKYVQSKFSYEKKFKIAVDCGNGATSLVIPHLYEEIGFEVVPLFDEPDPKFPNRPSEPNEESLNQLSSLVKETKVDFAAGFDGDGDRCVIIDENGNVISADEFAIIIADYLLNTGENN